MTNQHVLHSESAVDQALHRTDLVPPRPGTNLGTGAVARLRADMARFSSGDAHRERRRAVESAIRRIDLDLLTELAEEETTAAMSGAPLCIEALAATVPTRAVARSLGVGAEELHTVSAAVEAIARTIGRGESVDDTTDQQCTWLLDRFADHPDGAVAAVSVLYQNRDATESLLMATVHQRRSPADEVRQPAVSGTVRQATEGVTLGSLRLSGGDCVRLEFTLAQEFGAGPHRCPGEAMARCLVAAIVVAAAAVVEEEPG